MDGWIVCKLVFWELRCSGFIYLFDRVELGGEGVVGLDGLDGYIYIYV